MSIFDREPTDWPELQNLVAQLFFGLGPETVVGRRLALVRRSKEINVWVRDPQQLIETYMPFIHLCPGPASTGFVWPLPMTLPALDSKGNVSGEIIPNSYRQVYDFIDVNKNTALKNFQILHGEINA